MLEIKNLKKGYKSFDLDASLEVKSGRITGIIGQNGAGKSTIFKAVLGLIPFDGGSVKILGKDSADFEARDRERLGVVLADSGFSGYFTVKDIIYVLKGMYKKFNSEFFSEKIEKFGLPVDKQIKEFSTGMQAKLKLLIAMSYGAELLILDEPTTGLDVVVRDDMLLLLREYMEEDENRAILISSHISSDLESLCDDLYLIHEGKIKLHEDTDVLLSDYALIKMNAEQYELLDKKYILASKKESYGYSCLVRERRYYMENYPGTVIENCGIDTVISMMIRGEKA